MRDDPNNAGKRRVVIIGAGPGGLTAGIALHQAGFDALVFDRCSDGQDAGSGLTLWPNATKALGYLGLARTVSTASHSVPAITMRSWDGRTLFKLPSDGQLHDHEVQGAALLRSELLSVLRNRLDPRALRFNKNCVGYRQNENGVTALFEDGLEVDGELLIAADGIRSHIRSQLVGPGSLRYAGYMVWRGVAKFSLDENVGVTAIGRGAQFGFFPMTGNRVYWFACANAAEGDCDSRAGTGTELLRRFGGWHKPIPELIAGTQECGIIGTDIHDRDPLKRWSYGRVTLLGDAAHPSTPTLGQGACQAIEDAVVLATCLNEAAGVPEALACYESRRLKRTSSLTLQARRFGQMGCWKNPVACWVRDKLIGNIPESMRLRQLSKTFCFDLAHPPAKAVTQ
jgi:2-polyprenyl-6-methoxyphenol hydroxylase-like FAD-dependent oxidoreductase